MKENNYILISKYLSDSATEKEIEEFQNWLNKDVRNQAAFEEAKKLWESSLSLKKTKEYDNESAWEDFQLKAQKQNKNTPLLYLRIAASITLFIFLGVLVKFFVFDSDTEKNTLVKKEIPTVQKIQDTTSAAQIQVVDSRPIKTIAYTPRKINFVTSGDTAMVFLLPDSTQVYLNKNSKISYASTFNAKERRINLSGEAYFEIHPGKTQFIVACKNAIIKDIGTSFNVRAFQKDSLVEINVVTGIVSVSTEKSKTSEPIVLKAGNNALYNPTNHVNTTIKHKRNLKWWKNKGIKNRIKEFFERLRNKNH